MGSGRARGADRLATGMAITVAVALAASLTLLNRAAVPDTTRASSPLHAEALGVDDRGQRVVLDADGLERLVPGTRALDQATADVQRSWLASGTVPGAGTRWEPMVRDALLDLAVLSLPVPSTPEDGEDGEDGEEEAAQPGSPGDPAGDTAGDQLGDPITDVSGSDAGTHQLAVVAGWSAPWRYVWPRDAAFVAAAYARTGRLDAAEAVLTHLQQVQPASGRFQARYLPDDSGDVPDQRGEEADGPGWTLWSLSVLIDSLGEPAARRAALTRLRPLLIRSTRACLALIAQGRGLPPAGLDYWEIRTRRPTLGLAAPTLIGLEAASGLLPIVGEETLATTAARTARALDRTITRIFGSRGYPRTVVGSGRDAAICFLLPPFRTIQPSARLRTAWRAAQREMRRPAGGLAPGADWRTDGVSWTPETALFGLTAAGTGDRQTAEHWLTWLDSHRTSGGALPEKVLADGSPAAVAPLAWTAALVILTVDSLDRSAPIAVTSG